MSEDDRELLGHIANMSDQELVNLVEVDYENYQEEAVELAKEELKKRNPDRVYPDKDSSGNLISKEVRTEEPEYTAMGELLPQADTKSEEKRELHPWLRYFARNIDSFLIAFVLAFILKTIAPNVLSFIRGTFNGVIYYCVSFIIEILVEGLLLSTWGTTVGKWLFNIRVRDAADNIVSYNTAIKRAAMVLLYGRGLCIPIVGLIAEIASYDSLMKRKITQWDVACETRVICESIGVLRGILAAVVVIASLYATVYYI